jgi:predicted O-methyltransferase YrrM
LAKFNITRIVPDGFVHTSGFLEVIDSLSWALASLGHEVNVTQNWLSEHNETNIVFGAEVVSDHQRFPPGSIIFNLEQPSHPNMEKVRRLAKDCIVWEFSMVNVQEWVKQGNDAKHVPIGYTPNLTRIPKSSLKDWDIFFCGWMTPRRVSLIEKLRAAGLRVFASTACYGGGRDNIISRSKLCLNVHHDGRDMFEIVRCSYLMANSKCILSEESSDDQDYLDLRITRCNYRSLVDTAVQICKNDSIRSGMEQQSFDSIRSRDFIQSVDAAINGFSRYYATNLNPPSVIETYNVLAPSATEKKEGDSRVWARYGKSCNEGDMRDFATWMFEHAKGNVMEIGVRDGASTSSFLLGVERHGGHVYSVDVQDVGHLFKGHHQWTFIHANSTDFQTVIKQIPFEIDLLLIDGDHSRAGVINDFQYARQLRPGGMVLFHDIAPELRPAGCSDMSWPGDDVKNVFEEFAAALAPQGWTKEVLPGKYGMGILRKPTVKHE